MTGTDRAAALAQARRRHPCTSYRLPDRWLRARVARSLEDLAFPEVAAAVLERRGRSGLSPEDFARHVGVELSVVVRAEAGQLAPDELPIELVAGTRGAG